MSSNPPDPHGPTHSTRRGRQASAGESNPLYKLIMFFNLVMTFVTTCANKHIVENRSTDSTVSPTQTGSQNMQDIDDVTRRAVYAFIIILYIMSAVVVVIVDVARSDGTANRFFLAITHLLLFLAGILYLSGDNILLLHRRFEAIIGVTEAKDVRSYMVAISLALMIVSRIIPYVKKLVDDLEKPPQALDVIYNSTDKTWKIRVPVGYHPEWKTDKNWHLHYPHSSDSDTSDSDSDSDTSDSELTNLKLKQEIHVFPTTKLVSTSPEDNVKAKVRLMQVRGEFIQRTEIDIIIENVSQKEVSNSRIKKTEYHTHQGEKRKYESQILSMKGTSPMIEMSGSWKGTFQITQFTIDNNQPSETPVPHKTAMTFLVGFYVNLIDYTLIADALYTTVLDEITHQDRNIAEGYDCPPGHVTLAMIILGFLSFVWGTAIILMLIVTLRSDRYECLGSWEDFKERIFIEPKSVLTIIDRTIQTKVEKFNSMVETYCEQKSNPGTNHCYCKLRCCRYVIGLCLYIVCVLFVVIAFIIFIISATMASKNECKLLQAVLGIIGCIIGLFFVVLICFVSVNEVCNNCCCDILSWIREIVIETSNGDRKCGWFQCSMGLIISLVTFFLILYLPMYLIADNKFPWICYLPANDKTQWDYARYTLIIASLVIMNIPTVLYHLLTAQVKSLDKQNYVSEQSSATEQDDESADINLSLFDMHEMT